MRGSCGEAGPNESRIKRALAATESVNELAEEVIIRTHFIEFVTIKPAPTVSMTQAVILATSKRHPNLKVSGTPRTIGELTCILFMSQNGSALLHDGSSLHNII